MLPAPTATDQTERKKTKELPLKQKRGLIFHNNQRVVLSGGDLQATKHNIL